MRGAGREKGENAGQEKDVRRKQRFGPRLFCALCVLGGQIEIPDSGILETPLIPAILHPPNPSGAPSARGL
jgi:hypothetical protein